MDRVKLKPGLAVRRVPSDDCILVQWDGSEYRPHGGEWVEVIPLMRVGETQAFLHLRQAGGRLAAAQGEADEADQVLSITAAAFDELITVLGERLIAWNWTDDYGEPLASPHRNVVVLRQLRAAELMWLLTAAQGETAAAEKKDGVS